jgi:protein required for attachment to host cells
MMPKLTIRAEDWVLVSDGHKALLLANDGDEMFPNLVIRETFSREEVPNRYLHSDRPGRVHQSAAICKSSVEQTNRQEEREQAFLAEVSAHLADLVDQGQARGFIIVAPPRALGHLRKTYKQGLRSMIRAEVDQDLTKLPTYEIERHLVGVPRVI